MTTYRLLHVEDSTHDADLLRHALEGAPFAFTLHRVETEAQYLAELDAAPPDAILCDYNLPGFSAERALEIIRTRDPDLPFIIISHHVDETAAVIAMQNGASDYLSKRRLRRLPKAIESAVDRGNARREKARAQEALRESEAIRRGILNSLSSRIALLDGEGTIVIVNKAWDEFENERASMRLGHAVGGTNYLQALQEAHDCGDAFAGPLAEGVRAVIAREKSEFSMEYEIATASGTSWHIARVMPLEGSGESTVISHRDVTDRMLSHVAMEDANQRLQTISKRMLALQEEERRAISRELHDDIGQTLGALKIGLHRLTTASAAEQPELISECLRAAAEALEKLRLLATELRPPQLDQLGLEEALEWLAHRQSAASGVIVTCKFAGLEARPPSAIESACYRIAQEALNNATRHAEAKRVTISAESDGSLLKLVVHDDGIGFDAAAARRRVIRSGSMGLIGMEERAHLAGGQLKLRSAPGGGTTVSATFPLAGMNHGKADFLATVTRP
jgi:two-component system, NarL family, sensor histidine kinase UhpB